MNTRPPFRSMSTQSIFLLSLAIYASLSLVVRSHDQPLIAPQSVEEYNQLRNKCEWKPLQGKVLECGGKGLHCQIDASLPEGTGYWEIVRIGHFTTSGGELQYGCEATNDVVDSHPGTWVTRTVAGNVEPNSGEFLGFPPLVVLSANMSTTSKAYIPESLPDDIYQRLPWLLDSLSGTQSSSQCLRNEGGANCNMKVLPAGFGQKRYRTNGLTQYSFRNMDIRDMGAPPVASIMEFGQFHLTKPHSENVGKFQSAVAAQFAVGSDLTLDYSLKIGVPMYNFVTYFIPTRMMFMGNTVNFHSKEGDELWVVRGTQSDLGIPAAQQRPTIHKRDPERDNMKAPWAVGAPVNIEPGDTLNNVMSRMEASIKKAAAAFAEANEGKTRVSRAVDETGPHEGKFTFYDVNGNPTPPAQPEILCKYSGEVEDFNQDVINEDIASLKQKFSDLNINFNRRRRRTTTATGTAAAAAAAAASTGVEFSAWNESAVRRNLRAHYTVPERFASSSLSSSSSSAAAATVDDIDAEDKDEFIVLSEENLQNHLTTNNKRHRRTSNWSPYVRHSSVSYEVVTPKDQIFGYQKSTLPGEYYRVPRSSAVKQDSVYGVQCNSFKADAGEFITLVHFSVPRGYLSKSRRQMAYDPYDLIKRQSTVLQSYIHMPDLTWFK